MRGTMENKQEIINDKAILSAFFPAQVVNPWPDNPPSTDSLLHHVQGETQLDYLSKQMPYHVPENYFETDIPKPATKAQYTPLYKWLQAACIALVLGMNGLIFHKNHKPLHSTKTPTEMNTDDAWWYLENHVLNNDLSWYEWEEKMINDKHFVFQNNTPALPEMTIEELTYFF